MIAWGNDEYGQLGNGLNETDVPSEIPVPGLANVTQVSAGVYHSLAVFRNFFWIKSMN